MIVDSHVHFWDPSVLHYGWLNEVSALDRAFGVGDYEPFADRSVHAALFVEANCDAGESELEVAMVDGWAERDNRIAGIVAHVDLLDLTERDATLAKFRERERVVGIRHNIQGRGVEFCTQPEFVSGVRTVGECGFVFDLCATANELSDVRQLVEQCEQTQFVLDHCGKPNVDDGDFDKWGRDLNAVARLPNVSCKLSGLFTQTTSTPADGVVLRYLRHAVDCFGVERVMYGSDWPVCTLNGGAGRWQSLVQQLSENWSTADRDALFGGNAQRVYKLSISGSA